jgi:hypothetical protein
VTVADLKSREYSGISSGNDILATALLARNMAVYLPEITPG